MYKTSVIGRYLPGVLIVLGIVAAFVILHMGFPLLIGVGLIGVLAVFIASVVMAWGVIERRIHTGKWVRA